MKHALLVPLSLAVVGCVSLDIQRLDEAVRPARPVDSLVVLDEAPDEPYTVIAVVGSSVDGALQGFDDLRREMAAEAARLGGDALILGSPSKKTRVIFVPTPIATPIFYDEMKLTGEVITFD